MVISTVCRTLPSPQQVCISTTDCEHGTSFCYVAQGDSRRSWFPTHKLQEDAAASAKSRGRGLVSAADHGCECEDWISKAAEWVIKLSSVSMATHLLLAPRPLVPFASPLQTPPPLRCRNGAFDVLLLLDTAVCRRRSNKTAFLILDVSVLLLLQLMILRLCCTTDRLSIR